MLRLAGVKVRSQELLEARALYRLALDLYSNSWRAHDGLAQVADKMGEPGEAIKHYTRARDLNPKDENALEALKRLIAIRGR